MGDTLSLPVRLIGLAAPGEILVSPQVGRSVEGWFELQDRAPPFGTGSGDQANAHAVTESRARRLPLAMHGGYPFKGELLLRHATRKGASRTVLTATSTVAEVEIGEAGRLPAVVAAETCLLQALDIAWRQQAKSLELRAALSLSELWQWQGKRDAAHGLLAGTYGWFTEGFDTADLKEVKALLNQLS